MQITSDTWYHNSYIPCKTTEYPELRFSQAVTVFSRQYDTYLSHFVLSNNE